MTKQKLTLLLSTTLYTETHVKSIVNKWGIYSTFLVEKPQILWFLVVKNRNRWYNSIYIVSKYGILGVRSMRENDIQSELIIGRNPVMEALRAEREIDTLFVAKGERQGSVGKIIAMCRDMGVMVKETDLKKLDYMCGGANHQGVIARVAAHSYASVDDIFARAEEKGEKPFIIICDEIEDPHNLGAIIRTAECAGAHGIIIPKRRSATLNFTVAKTSAGALEYMPVARVSNLVNTIDELKSRGVWIYGTDMDGEVWCQTDLRDSMALIVGSEGKGMGRLVREKCDFVLSLPMVGEINSLNASVAAGIVMYEASRQRQNIKSV